TSSCPARGSRRRRSRARWSYRRRNTARRRSCWRGAGWGSNIATRLWKWVSELKVIDDISEMVGRTPMLRCRKLFPDAPATIVAKLELFNPMSVKDRPVKHIIERALAEGRIKPGAELVEASSGNTAIAIAMFGAAQGFAVRIFMSENC